MKYVLMTGKHYKEDGTLCKAGDVVELNAAQAEAFKDKFKSLAAVEAERDARTADVKAQEEAAAKEAKRLADEAAAQAAAAKDGKDGKADNPSTPGTATPQAKTNGK